MSVKTFCAYILQTRQPDANKEPDIVTGRQPYLLTNEDEIGPGCANTKIFKIYCTHKR